jgi:hypothetical protein
LKIRVVISTIRHRAISHRNEQFLNDLRFEYVQSLLRDSREELTRADSKVTVLLGTAGVGASIIAGDIAAGHWTPTSLASWAQALWWLGMCAATAGFAALTYALAPRLYDSGEKKNLRHFGHIAQYTSVSDLVGSLDNASSDIFSARVSQLWSISHIVARKYALIRVTLQLFATSIALLIVARLAG